MKYKLFEEYTDQQNDGHPGFLKSKEEIRNWLEVNIIRYSPSVYTINEDCTVDVNDNCSLKKFSDFILVNFKVVHGFFDCSLNSLKSLEGCPDIVEGDFDCHNNDLKTLKYAPDIVNGSFVCWSNDLVTLQYSPKYVGKNFDCRKNSSLVILGHKSKIKGDFIHDDWVYMNRWIKLRAKTYLKYLDTLDEQEQLSSLSWLRDVDENFHKSVVEYAINNNIDMPGVDMDIAKDASKHKDSGLF